MTYKNREKRKEWAKKWREKNKDKIIAYFQSDNGRAAKARGAAKAKAKRLEYEASPEGIAKREAKEKCLAELASTKEERARIARKEEYARRRERDIASGKIVPKIRLLPEEKKEAKRIARKNRKAREKAAKGKLSRGIRKILYAAQKGRCPVCKNKLILEGEKKFHIDHIIPLSSDGTNTDDNVQLLCFECNVSKGAKLSHVFMQSRGFLL